MTIRNVHLRGRGGADGPTKFLEIQGPGPDDNYLSPFQRGEAQPTPYLFSSTELNRLALTTITNVQRQLPGDNYKCAWRCCCALGLDPCGKRAAFSSRRPREAGFPWKGGRDPWETAPFAVFHGRGPAFHGKSAPEQGTAPGGSGGVRPLRIPPAGASAPWPRRPGSWCR